MTMKVAEQFFRENKFQLNESNNFYDTDLAVYLEMMYGEKPVIDHEKGIIKVVREYIGNTRTDNLHFFENIFYDFEPKDLGVIEYYINVPGMEISSPNIVNTPIGKKLATEGYAVLNVENSYQDLILKRFPYVPFNKTPEEEGLKEPFATYKFGERIWDTQRPYTNETNLNLIYYGIRDLMEQTLGFSGVLSSLNAFDLNLLEWREGRAMEAHNGIDYKSFVNLITYNTECCYQTRDISVGEYDWYDTVCEALKTEYYEELMNIQKEKEEFKKISVQTNRAILVNAYNPRFYHQVGEMKGEGRLYVCTSNMSFRSIVDKFNFRW